MFDSISLWLSSARLGIIILTILLVWATYQSNIYLKKLKPDFNLLLSWPESLMRLVLIGLCLLLAWMTGLSATQLGLSLPHPLLRNVGLGLAIGLIVQIIINLLTMGAISYFGSHIYSIQVIKNILPRRPIEWLWVPLAFIPAVAMEELLFRTLWLGGFQAIIPIPLLIIGTSLLFGFMHTPQGALGMITAGTANILLCLLFLGFGGILIPFITHYTVNVLQIMVAHYQKDWLEGMEPVLNDSPPFIDKIYRE